MRFPWVTPHASERYRERYAPCLTAGQAHGRLRWLAASALPTKERTFDGKEVWRSEHEPDVRLIVARDPGGILTVVTVAPREVAVEEVEIDGVDPAEMRAAMAAQGGRRRRR